MRRAARDTALVWFRNDLRLADNPAWAAATAEHSAVVALFVVDPQVLARAGPFRTRQLAAELAYLDDTLAGAGGRLQIRRGRPAVEVSRVVDATGAVAVHWNDDVSPYARSRDAAVRSAVGVPCHRHAGRFVQPPGAIRTAEGRVPRVFSAFHRAWLRTPWPDWPEPGTATVADDPGDGLPLCADGSPPATPGEHAASALLSTFLAGPVDTFTDRRDLPAADATSGLSVALHFGTLAARHAVKVAGSAAAGGEAFVRQLAWRDWFAHQLDEEPGLARRAMRPEYDRIAWRDDPAGWAAWTGGRTGYPLVDAGMRQLAATGRMPNRVRMVAASFLVKHLLVDWRRGESHFRRMLLDGDVAQNVGNWQWVAGTGPDAAPYFRVFNPVAQSRRHDPDGEYLRRWLAELAGLDRRAVHAPWEAGAEELAGAGVVLGESYPAPIVDHTTARARALAAYRAATAASRGAPG